MAPVGVFARPKGELVIVHRCLACGRVRHNRIGADDDLTVLQRLPLVQPGDGRRAAALGRTA